MNSLAKEHSNISIDDFSDSDNSEPSNQFFIPQEQNLLKELCRTQLSQLETADVKEDPQKKKKKNPLKINENKILTKDFLMDCIQRNKSFKENERLSSQSDYEKKQNSLKWLSDQKKVQKVTKINKNVKTKIVKDIFKNEKSYEKAKLEELFQQRIKIDNPRKTSTLMKNTFREKRIQQSTQKNTGKMMIQQLIFNNNNSVKIIYEQTKKICNVNKISPSDIIDAFILNIFKLQNSDQQKVILALKYFLNDMIYVNDKVDYYQIARLQIFTRLLKLLEGDEYGYHHHRNKNLLEIFFQMQVLTIEDIKSLVLYLFYCSTRYLVTQNYSKAEFYLDLTDIFYKAFHNVLNQFRDSCCDIYRCEAQGNLLEMYIQNCSNINFFQRNGSLFMKNFDELSQNKLFNIPIFISKILNIFAQQIRQQNRVPKILSTIETLIKVMNNI